MIALALSATAAGAFLGIRFSVLALIPVMICASGVAAIAWLTSHASFWSTLVELILFAICLQFGYLAGATFRAAWRTLVGQELRRNARIRPAGTVRPGAVG